MFWFGFLDVIMSSQVKFICLVLFMLLQTSFIENHDADVYNILGYSWAIKKLIFCNYTSNQAIWICYIEYIVLHVCTVCMRIKLGVINIQLYIQSCAIILFTFCDDIKIMQLEIWYTVYITLSEYTVIIQVGCTIYIQILRDCWLII